MSQQWKNIFPFKFLLFKKQNNLQCANDDSANLNDLKDTQNAFEEKELFREKALLILKEIEHQRQKKEFEEKERLREMEISQKEERDLRIMKFGLNLNFSQVKLLIHNLTMEKWISLE